MLAIWVTVTVKPERLAEFHRIIEEDSRGSREDEPGCYRFDVLQDQDRADVFSFYEVYADEEAAAAHKTMPHYLPWARFMETGLQEPPRLTRSRVIYPEPTSWSRRTGDAGP